MSDIKPTFTNSSPAEPPHFRRYASMAASAVTASAPRARTTSLALGTEARPSARAVGFAVARDLTGGQDHVIAVIGDGSMTGGMAFEAINHAGHVKTNLLIVLNDNEMSISPNVGALHATFTRIRTNRAYIKTKEADRVAGA